MDLEALYNSIDAHKLNDFVNDKKVVGLSMSSAAAFREGRDSVLLDIGFGRTVESMYKIDVRATCDGRKFMRHRLGELLQFIMREIAELPGRPDQSEEIRNVLSSKGYEPAEIDTVLQMIDEGAARSTHVDTGSFAVRENMDWPGRPRRSHRVLASWERSKFTMNAQELLLWLDTEGFLWPEEREDAISRCMDVDGIVDDDELMAVVVWSVLPYGDPRRHQILLEAGGDMDVGETPVH